jgi:hypothetical protein
VQLLAAELEPALDRLVRRALDADPAARPGAWDIDSALGAVAAPARALSAFPEMVAARGRATGAARPGFAEPAAPLLTPPPRPSAPAVVIRRSKNLARDDEG